MRGKYEIAGAPDPQSVAFLTGEVSSVFFLFLFCFYFYYLFFCFLRVRLVYI